MLRGCGSARGRADTTGCPHPRRNLFPPERNSLLWVFPLRRSMPFSPLRRVFSRGFRPYHSFRRKLKAPTISSQWGCLFLPRSSPTLVATNSAARSSSSIVVGRPRLKRTAPNPRSAVIPMALSTPDSSPLPSWHADPVDAAISGVAARRSQPVIPRKLTLRVLGSLFDRWPFNSTPSIRRLSFS